MTDNDHVSARDGSGNSTAFSTIYKGTLFQTRHEAHWASFFECVGWHWRYRPLDLTYWTPDFIIGGDMRTGGIPVEVLPVDLMRMNAAGRQVAFDLHAQQLERAKKSVVEGLLVVGTQPNYECDYNRTAYLGVFFSEWHENGVAQYFNANKKEGNQLDFVPWGAPYRGAMTRRSYNHDIRQIVPMVPWEEGIEPLWRRAGDALAASENR